ncbi:MAG TPA: hypothetical protein VES39_02765, partial [Rhodospirillales bacterium]|nr:hypothetical protein [Rhodospirillales bacterium]
MTWQSPATTRPASDGGTPAVECCAHAMAFGAECIPGGGVRFRLWAPDAERVTLLLDGVPCNAELPLAANGDGWCEAVVPDAGAGSRYRFRIDGGLAVPDPASRFQPEDVH